MEFWDIYDADKKLTGRKHQRIKVPGTRNKLGEGEYHLVVGIWTVNSNGQILLTQRHPDKDGGLLWECSGGGVVAGETSLEGAVRELGEEIGLFVKPEELTLLGSLRLTDFFIDTYKCQADIEIKDLVLQPEEVVDAKWVTLDEIEKMNEEGLLVGAEWEEFKLYQERLLNQ